MDCCDLKHFCRRCGVMWCDHYWCECEEDEDDE